jgi:hypothetical protein
MGNEVNLQQGNTLSASVADHLFALTRGLSEVFLPPLMQLAAVGFVVA